MAKFALSTPSLPHLPELIEEPDESGSWSRQVSASFEDYAYGHGFSTRQASAQSAKSAATYGSVESCSTLTSGLAQPTPIDELSLGVKAIIGMQCIFYLAPGMLQPCNANLFCSTFCRRSSQHALANRTKLLG